MREKYVCVYVMLVFHSPAVADKLRQYKSRWKHKSNCKHVHFSRCQNNVEFLMETLNLLWKTTNFHLEHVSRTCANVSRSSLTV